MLIVMPVQEASNLAPSISEEECLLCHRSATRYQLHEILKFCHHPLCASCAEVLDLFGADQNHAIECPFCELEMFENELGSAGLNEHRTDSVAENELRPTTAVMMFDNGRQRIRDDTPSDTSIEHPPPSSSMSFHLTQNTEIPVLTYPSSLNPLGKPGKLRCASYYDIKEHIRMERKRSELRKQKGTHVVTERNHWTSSRRARGEKEHEGVTWDSDDHGDSDSDNEEQQHEPAVFVLGDNEATEQQDAGNIAYRESYNADSISDDVSDVEVLENSALTEIGNDDGPLIQRNCFDELVKSVVLEFSPSPNEDPEDFETQRELQIEEEFNTSPCKGNRVKYVYQWILDEGNFPNPPDLTDVDETSDIEGPGFDSDDESADDKYYDAFWDLKAVASP